MRGPGREAQGRRLSPQFQRLTDAFNAERLRAAGRPEGLEPEQILVLELAGDVENFAAAMTRVPGFEFLAEQAEDMLEPDEEFATVDQEGRRRSYRRQLFLVATDDRAWQELLRLWGLWQREQPLPWGLAPFRYLFEQLRELRPWDDRDRLTRAGAAQTWRRDLSEMGDELIPFEIELWLRSDRARREAGVSDIREELRQAGGRIRDEAMHPDISYHGLLGEAPASLLVDAAERSDVTWMSTHGVRLFHPIGQVAPPPLGDDAPAEAVEPIETAAPRDDAPLRVALLDGMPLENHAPSAVVSLLRTPTG